LESEASVAFATGRGRSLRMLKIIRADYRGQPQYIGRSK
jgi:hypothetical protein